MVRKHRKWIVCFEWLSAVDGFVKNNTQRIEIATRIDGATRTLLWRHVRRRTEHGTNRCNAFGILLEWHLGNAEIEHFDGRRVTCPRDEHHVFGLEISMDDVMRMRGSERTGNLLSDVEGELWCESLVPPETVPQAFAFHVLEHEVERAILEPPEISGHGNILVVNARRRDGLALEARHSFRVTRHLGVKNLECDGFAQLYVRGTVNRTHSTLANQLLDAIAIGNQLANERLRCRLRLFGHAFWHTRNGPRRLLSHGPGVENASKCGVPSFGVRHAARGMVELGRQFLAHEWRIST